MERHWLILIATETVVGLTIIIGLIIHERFHKDNCPDEVCQNHDCIQAAARILNYIDVNVDPCDNFYQFSCGNFLKTAEIRDDMNEISSTTIVEENLAKQLRNCLEEPENLNEIRPFKLLKRYYKSCMDIENIARKGLRVVRELLEKMGGWPVMKDSSWDKEDLQWHYYIYKFRKMGLPTDFLIKLDVKNDYRNSSVYKIKLDKPELSLPWEILINPTNNEYVEEYRRYMLNVAIYLGVNHYRSVTALKEVLNFEIRLAKISSSNADSANITDAYEIESIRELEEDFTEIPWYTYITNLIDSQVPITRSEIIMVMAPDYFRKLDTELRETPRRVQINYLVWRAIESIIPYLIGSLRETQLKFRSKILGITENPPRWKECVREVYKNLPLALSAKYVRVYIDEDAKTDAEHIVKNIKKEFVDSLEKIDWMDKKTKQSALDKVNALNEIVAFPEELFDDDKLNELHKDLEVNSEEYLYSFLNISKWKENMKFKNLRALKSKISWIQLGEVAEINPTYNAVLNTILIPAGILQGGYFNRNFPDYLNYGGIGFEIAHRIISAFDDVGRKFDKNGNQDDWWRIKAEMSYEEKSSCFISRYENITVEGLNQTLNGSLTLDSNIADSAGIKYAYLAYKTLLKEKGGEIKLPGMDYTPQQLFWLNFAINQCTKQRIEHLKLLIATDVWTPPELRVLGVLKNSVHFSEDFECSNESPMYSEDICELW